MPDYGATVADKAIRGIDRKLQQTYKTAREELEEKLKDFEKRHAARDAMMRQRVQDGKMSQQEYQDWLAGQVFIRGQWQDKIRQVSAVLTDHDQQAANIINERKLDVFAENYNHEAYVAEKTLGISFGIYNTQAVAKLIQEDPQILPEWEINKPKEYEWCYKKVNNIVKQGIIQGEDIQQITARLCRDLAAQSEGRMRLFARTAITGAQNAGRQQQMEDAARMGIEIHKQWLATLDSRTRDAHRRLDGQEVPFDEPFKIDGQEINYPGDPTAHPALVYNCRCTVVSVYPKYEDRAKPDWRESETIDGQSYQEWKQAKEQKGKTHQPTNLDSRIQRATMPLIAGVSIGEPMTHAQADTGRVNPLFKQSESYRNNCQSCVVAYELRLRGYDIEAIARDKTNTIQEALAHDSRIAWKNKDGTDARFDFGGGNTWYPKGRFNADEIPTAKRFEKKLLDILDQNGRYTLEFPWKGRNAGAHIVMLEKDVDQLVIYDPQSNRIYRGIQVSAYLKDVKYSVQHNGRSYYRYPGVTRIDDKDININVANAVLKKRDEDK